MAVSYDTNEWCTYEKITRLLKNLGAQNSHHTLKNLPKKEIFVYSQIH